MITINKYDFSGKKVLIRVDFNVPLDDTFRITDDTRIRAAVSTIKKVVKQGGSPILMSHLGRPKGGYEKRFSLIHLVPHLSELLSADVLFADDCIGENAINLSGKLNPGETLLLENLRFHKGEKKGDNDFASELSLLADTYINDAFGTAHRAHASTSVVAKYFPHNKMFGYLMHKEIENLDRVLNNAEQPFTAILGGAKVSGKIEVINRLLERIDNLIIGGGMAYTFAKAQGGSTGNSLIENDYIELARDIIDNAGNRGVRLCLPSDTVIANSFSNEAERNTTLFGDIPDGWMGLDIGKESCKEFTSVIEQSKTILWNGPMGVFEMSNFEYGTKFIAESIARSTGKGAFSLIGGGDSVAAINKFHLTDKVSYVSTGGGAMLEYIEGKTLPGIKAIMS